MQRSPGRKDAIQGGLRQVGLGRCISGLTASLILCFTATVGFAQTEDGIPGVPTGPVNAVSPSATDAADALQAEALGTPASHERGYPMNLDAARKLSALPGPGPQDVVTMEPPSAGPAALAPALGTNFDGIGDTGVIPADPNLAVGRQRIIQVVNSTFRITTRTGTSPDTRTLSSFFGTPSGGTGFAFDPRALYDHFANRFVILALTTNAARTDSWYLIAVSKTETPTTSQSSWNRYHLRSDKVGSTDPSAWGDYAPIGFDNTNFYVTSNQFTPAGSFIAAKISKYAKAPFYSGSSVSGVSWNNVTDTTGTKVFTIQPAVTFGVPGHQWLAAVPFGSGSRLAAFRITGNSLFKFNVPIGSTSLPDLARQKGISTRIDSGDNRLQNAVFSNNRFYTCHTVKSGSFPCAARYIGINTTSISAPTRVLDRVIGSSTTDYYYPAVATNPAGSASSRLATVFNFSSAVRFGGILYTQMTPAGTIQPLGLAKEGQNSYVKTFSGTRNRWGDYNGICRDPLNSNRFFFNAMYAKSTANVWGTYVASTTVSTTTAPEQGIATNTGVGPVTNSASSAAIASGRPGGNGIPVPPGGLNGLKNINRNLPGTARRDVLSGRP